MKHNEPSIAPIAHTKKYILALLLACGAASSQCHGMPPAVAALVISAIGLGADLVHKTGDAVFGSEEATLSVQLHSYDFRRTIEYPIVGKTYEHRWRVSHDWKGNLAYIYYMVENGATVPASLSTSPFTLGGQNGLPLTKRVYKCQRITPNSNIIESESSFMDLKVSHTVTKPGGYWYTPPVSVDVDLNFVVNRLPDTCDGQTLTGLPKTSSCSVMRNGSIIWSYPHVNYDAIGGNMIIP